MNTKHYNEMIILKINEVIGPDLTNSLFLFLAGPPKLSLIPVSSTAYQSNVPEPSWGIQGRNCGVLRPSDPPHNSTLRNSYAM